MEEADNIDGVGDGGVERRESHLFMRIAQIHRVWFSSELQPGISPGEIVQFAFRKKSSTNMVTGIREASLKSVTDSKCFSMWHVMRVVFITSS